MTDTISALPAIIEPAPALPVETAADHPEVDAAAVVAGEVVPELSERDFHVMAARAADVAWPVPGLRRRRNRIR
jgi:hypothetical protein